MPLYTYKCPKCTKELTDLFNINDPPPKCDNETEHPGEHPEMVKLLGNVSFKI